MSTTHASPDRTFTVDGNHGPIACTEWSGDGPTALLIHGVNGSAGAWTTIAGHVRGRRQLVAVDLRGRGSSPASPPWGVAPHADDVAAVLALLVEGNGGPATVAGHSFGAHLAARAARVVPDLVSDMVLIDGGPPRRIPTGANRQDVIEGALANILPNLGALPYPVSAEAVEADFASMINDEAATASLAATTQPLVLVRAGHGVAPGLPPIVDDETLAELEAQRSVDSVLVPDATHFSLMDDHADAVATALLPTMRP